MRDTPFILAITDRLSGQLTNGSQVMAHAVFTQLSKWFNLKIIEHQQFDPEKLSDLVHPAPAIIYNFGCTSFSSELTAIIHSLAPEIPVINHFQLVLPEYARTEKYKEEAANELGVNCRHVAEHALHNIFPSFGELNRVLRLGWQIQRANNCVIKNVFIPAPSIEPAPASSSSITFMGAGRFSDYVKGADLLYRAFSQYYEQDEDAHLLIAGDEKRFISLLNNLPSTAYTYLGWLPREELHAWFQQADVVVVPSRYEPFGLVAIEAMAMGTPVIAMAVDGLAEIVHHNRTGWLVDPNEGSLGLRAAMQQASHQKDRLVAMGELCKTVIEQEYSLKMVAGQIRKLFDNTFAFTSESPASVNKPPTPVLDKIDHHA